MLSRYQRLMNKFVDAHHTNKRSGAIIMEKSGKDCLAFNGDRAPVKTRLVAG